MGCWNETCFLTNLPIFPGEDIATLLLFPTSEGMGECRPCYEWYPSPFLIYGEYDDYGGIENPRTPVSEYILKELNASSLEKLLNIENTIELPTKDNFLKKLKAEGHLLIAQPTYIRKSAFDTFLDTYEWQDWSDSPVVTYQTLLDNIPEYIERIGRHVDKWSDLSTGRPSLYMSLPDTQHRDPNYLARFSWHHSKDVLYDFFGETFAEHVVDLYKQDKTEEMQVFFAEFAKFIMLSLFMSNSRRYYYPNRGYSQQTETDNQRFIANLILTEADMLDSRWDEDDLPDDMWDPVREVFMEQAGFKF